MVRRLICSFALFGVGACLPVLGGCGATAPSTFYILSAMPTSGTAKPIPKGEESPLIGIGPIEVAGYLDRPQIATRASQNKLQYSEFDKWAEPLGDNIGLVLSENLSSLLGTDRIVTRPWGSAPVKYMVFMRVKRLDGMVDGDVTLVARWAISKAVSKEFLVAKTSRFSAPFQDGNYEAMAATMSQMVAQLSREVAEALKPWLSKDQEQKRTRKRGKEDGS